MNESYENTLGEGGAAAEVGVVDRLVSLERPMARGTTVGRPPLLIMITF